MTLWRIEETELSCIDEKKNHYNHLEKKLAPLTWFLRFPHFFNIIWVNYSIWGTVTQWDIKNLTFVRIQNWRHFPSRAAIWPFWNVFQRLAVPQMIDQFGRKRCQKKRKDVDFKLLLRVLSKIFCCKWMVGCQKFSQYIRMLWPGRFILIESVFAHCIGYNWLEKFFFNGKYSIRPKVECNA